MLQKVATYLKRIDQYSALKLSDSFFSFLTNLIVLKKLSSENVSLIYYSLNLVSFIYIFVDFSQSNLLLTKNIYQEEKTFIYIKRIITVLLFITLVGIGKFYFQLDNLFCAYILYVFLDSCVKSFYLYFIEEDKSNLILIVLGKLITLSALLLYSLNKIVTNPIYLFLIYFFVAFFIFISNFRLNKIKSISARGFRKLHFISVKKLWKGSSYIFANQLSYIIRYLVISFIIQATFSHFAKDFRIVSIQLSLIQIFIFSFGYYFFSSTINFSEFFNRIFRFNFALIALTAFFLVSYKHFVLNIPLNIWDLLIILLSFSEFIYLIIATYYSLSLLKKQINWLTLFNLVLSITVYVVSISLKSSYHTFIICLFGLQYLFFIFLYSKRLLQ